MSFLKTKRIWDTATTRPDGDGFGVLLDDRPLRTPAKVGLVLPTLELAQEIAREWDAQGDVVKPDTMPFTRTANSAIDRVAPQKAAVADMLAAYGDADVLCYRADSPAALVTRQAAAWDPLLDWCADTLGARLRVRTGVIHQPQPAAATSRLAEYVHAFTHFELAGFHDLVALSGSLVLGLAVTHNYRTPAQAWALSRLDELWQIQQWGEDDDATSQQNVRKKSFFDAERFFRLSQIYD